LKNIRVFGGGLVTEESFTFATQRAQLFFNGKIVLLGWGCREIVAVSGDRFTVIQALFRSIFFLVSLAF